MQFLSLLLFVISSNLDGFVIGISYGIKQIQIPLRSNILIGVVTACGTLLSMLLGRQITPLIPDWATAAFGSGVLLLMGLFCIIGFVKKQLQFQKETEWPQKNPEKFDKNCSKEIELLEAVALGAALSLNNIGLGIGGSITGLPVLSTSIGSFCCSLLFLFLGNRIGNGWISKLIGKYAEPISGVIILLLGLWELLAGN